MNAAARLRRLISSKLVVEMLKVTDKTNDKRYEIGLRSLVPLCPFFHQFLFYSMSYSYSSRAGHY